MFCAKTHNMGFVSPADHKTPIVPLQGASLRDCRKRQERLRHKGELRPSLNPSASQNGKHCPCFSFCLWSACCVGCQILPATCVRNAERSTTGRSQFGLDCRYASAMLSAMRLMTDTQTELPACLYKRASLISVGSLKDLGNPCVLKHSCGVIFLMPCFVFIKQTL